MSRDRCSSKPDAFERIHNFVVHGANNELTDDHWADFERLLQEDDDACRLYLEYVEASDLLESILDSVANPEQPSSDACPPQQQGPVHHVAPGGFGNVFHSTVGYFSSGWPVAYLVATVVLGLGLLISSLMPVFQPAQVVRQSIPSPSVQMPFVGRITGMVDCQWVQRPESRAQSPALDPRPSTLVSLGDTFALSSGLMEISYDSGATVILQGPCTYEVESAAGGFLSVGKLTARVEKRSEIRSQKSEIRDRKSSDLRPLTSGLFAIRTPTATVTDLGTEFGIDVAESGDTVSYVFQGSVELHVVSASAPTQPFTCVLRESQSARVERTDNPDDGGNRVTVSDSSPNPVGFVRKMVRPPVRTLDLVDVVAGGDGFSGRRNRGIHPTTGQPCDSPPQEFNIDGDGAYHRVEGLPLVDGVFIPDDRSGPVTVDSAGHTFDGFATGANMTYGYVWAGGAIPTGTPPVVRTELSGVDYAAPGHGLIFLHANKGITFGLEAMRRANPGWKLGRFLAVAGNSEVASEGILGPLDKETAKSVCADIRVLVDGKLRWYRREISGANGGSPIAITIDDDDRFLTLVGSDAGNGIHADWTMFGDPRVELLPSKTGEATPSNIEKPVSEAQ